MLLGFEFARNVPVHRLEVLERIHANGPIVFAKNVGIGPDGLAITQLWARDPVTGRTAQVGCTCLLDTGYTCWEWLAALDCLGHTSCRRRPPESWRRC